MRRIAAPLAALLLAVSFGPSLAQQPANLPPHSALFGTWTGGVFPPPSTMSLQACLGTPVVIFTRDVVMRATLTQNTLTQREIQTARAVPGGIEFRFTAPAAPDSSLLGIGGAERLAGFGCESQDVLHVQRRGENVIVFPGCADFPNPLVRCR